MADASLDVFFAKKDKNKKKPKSKSGEADDPSKSARKDKKKDKDKTNFVASSGNKSHVTKKQEDDDDWNDFEEEKAVDYSGLRIHNLQITKEDQEKEGDGEEEEYDEDGEVKERKDGASGPWKKGSGHAASAASVPVDKPKVKDDSTTKTSGGKYVPPAQRLSATNSSTPGFPTSRRKKEAPNLRSEVDFPTLGGAPGQGQQYSSTASSDLVDNPNQRRGVSLALENKFSALQD